MLFADGGLALLFVALWLFCIIDVITTPEGTCRNLPKMVWLLIVIILADIGAIAWLIAGRPWAGRSSELPYKGNRGIDRPAATPVRRTNPDDDEEFLAQLKARAEEQRRRAREAQERERGSSDDDPTA